MHDLICCCTGIYIYCPNKLSSATRQYNYIMDLSSLLPLPHLLQGQGQDAIQQEFIKLISYTDSNYILCDFTV